MAAQVEVGYEAWRDGVMTLRILKVSAHFEGKGSYSNPKASAFVVAEPDGILTVSFPTEKPSIETLTEILRQLLRVAEVSVVRKLNEVEEGE